MTKKSIESAFDPKRPFTFEDYKVYIQRQKMVTSLVKSSSTQLGPPSAYTKRNKHELYITLLNTYRTKLPRYLLARCPLCGGEVWEHIDTFSLAGIGWWLHESWGAGWFGRIPPHSITRSSSYSPSSAYLPFEPSYEATCDCVRAVVYGVNFNGIFPDDVQAQKRTVTGSEKPGLLKPFMKQEGSCAVIHTLPVGRLDDEIWQPRYTVYFITYFNRDLASYERCFTDPPVSDHLFYWPYEEIDNRLATWLKRGKLYWLGTASEDYPLYQEPTKPYPYRHLKGLVGRWYIFGKDLSLWPTSLQMTDWMPTSNPPFKAIKPVEETALRRRKLKFIQKQILKSNPGSKRAFDRTVPFTFKDYKIFIKEQNALRLSVNHATSDRNSMPSQRAQRYKREFYITLLSTYRAKLPRYLLSRCPLCEATVSECVDTFSLAGLGWWLNESWGAGWFGPVPSPDFVKAPGFIPPHTYTYLPFEPSYEAGCNCLRAIVYGVNFNGILPDDVKADERTITGSEKPGLLKPFMGQDGSYAVIHTLPIGRLDDRVWQPRYTAYFIAYYNSDPSSYERSFTKPPVDATFFLWPYDDIDYDLATWIKKGKLYWLGAEAEGYPLKRSPVEAYPYHNLEGLIGRWYLFDGIGPLHLWSPTIRLDDWWPASSPSYRAMKKLAKEALEERGLKSIKG